MNINDKDFIKNIIQSDLSIIPDTRFTADTVSKLKESRNASTTYQSTYQSASNFIYPVLVYAIIVLITLMLRVFILPVVRDSVSFLNEVVKETSEILFNPVTVSISTSILLLYFLDSYLDKLKTKYS